MNTKTELQLPGLSPDWQKELAEAAKKNAANESGGSQWISTRSGIMSYQNQPLPDNAITVVVLATAAERSYYEQDFNPDNITPPLCFALADIDSDLHHHANSEKPQYEGPCAACDHAQWGSDPKFGRAQACKLRRRMLMIHVDCLAKGPEAILGADAIGLKVPPTSTTNWGKYVSQLSAVIKRPAFGVITKITSKPHPKFQFTLEFAFGGLIAEENLPAVMARKDALGDQILKPWDVEDAEEKQKREAAIKKEQEAKAARSKGSKRKY